MDKNIVADVTQMDSWKTAHKAVTADEVAYSIGKRKCIVERHYKSTDGLTLENILMKLIRSDFTKH